MRIKLMMVTLNEISNQYTKQGSDYHFVKGFKYQSNHDHQNALNAYEQGLREYPNSSFNCKFNIGVILFKLGLFKEALQCYQDLEKIEPLDKRICYNKAISELQNGKYNQCIITIDSYISDYNQRKEKFQKTKRGDKTLSYQERIQM